MRVRLGPLTPAHVPAITAAMQDPATVRWLSRIPQPYAEADARAFVAETREDLAILVDGVFAGVIRPSDELGYWLAPAFRGRGIGLRAAELGLSRHFDRGGGPVRAIWRNGNVPSARMLARLGFTGEAPVDLPIVSEGRSVPGFAATLTREAFVAARPLRVETGRMVIDSTTADDMAALHAIVTQPKVARMLFVFYPGMPRADFDALHQPYAAARPFRLAIRDHAGRAVGSIGVGEGEAPPIYYYLAPAVAGQGIASEVVPAFCAEVVDRFGLARLTAGVFDDNPASVRVLERAGFLRQRAEVLPSRGRTAPAPGHGFLWEEPASSD